MPQAIGALLVPLLGKAVAAIVGSVIFTTLVSIGVSLVSGLLMGRGSAKSDQTERTLKTATPARVHGYGERLLYGAQMLFETSSNGSTVDVWAFHDGQADGFVALYLNDEKANLSGGYVASFPDKSYGSNKVRFGYNLGAAIETAFAPVVSALPGIWTSNHRGDGIVSGYLIKAPESEKKFLERYPQGDNVTVALALRLQRCYDPRTGQNPNSPATWTYTTNAALHLLHYFMVRRGYDYATRIEPVESYWIAAANVCDEAMSLAGGGTEPRYRGCVVYDSTKLPGDIISELLACFDGWTALDENGCVLVYAGKLYEPTVSIGPSQIVAYSHQSFVEPEDMVNALTVQYVSKGHDYKTVECEPWRDEADISERGREINDGFSPQVPSHTQARRLAKRAMLRRNAPNRGTVTTNIAGRTVIGHRYIHLLIEEAGAVFFDGIAEIVEMERDYDTGGVTFSWIEAPADMDDWNAPEEDGAPAPGATSSGSTALPRPTISDIYSAVFGGGVRLSVQTDAAVSRDDVEWRARWRVAGEAEWSPEKTFGEETSGAATLLTDLVPDGQNVELQTAYRVGDGRFSDWSDTAAVGTTQTRGAHTLLTRSVAYPVISDDDSIAVEAFEGVLDTGGVIEFPETTLSSLSSGTRYGVFWHIVNEAYSAVASPAATEMASPAYVFLGWTSTSTGGSYPADPTPPGGWGGEGSYGQHQV